MNRTRIFAYAHYSASAKALSAVTGYLRIKHTRSRFRPRVGDRIINWGASAMPARLLNSQAQIVNHPSAVTIAVNKLRCLTAIPSSYQLPYTTDKAVAMQWADERSTIVVCRTTLTGRSGQGIVLARSSGEVVDAPLYTRYIPKLHEYRVHVYNRRVIDFAEKKRRRPPAVVQNDLIRSHNNGWVFARTDIELPENVAHAAIESIGAVGLDFGAADIVLDKRTAKPYVLEINTAPGLFGTTLEKYHAAFTA